MNILAKPIMKNNSQEKQQEKAARILELNLELRDLQSKRKSVAGAFTTRIKEVKQDILDIVFDQQTANGSRRRRAASAV